MRKVRVECEKLPPEPSFALLVKNQSDGGIKILLLMNNLEGGREVGGAIYSVGFVKEQYFIIGATFLLLQLNLHYYGRSW